MEGWINIKRGWFWQTRYGFIGGGQFKYFDDQRMTKLKRQFKLNDHSIVQNRENKTIRLMLGSNEQVQIKSELHELWYSKLIQAKVSTMNINYIPQQEAQDIIRRNSQGDHRSSQEPDNYNPNTDVDLLNYSTVNTQQSIQRQGIHNRQQPQFRNYNESQIIERNFQSDNHANNQEQRNNEQQKLQRQQQTNQQLQYQQQQEQQNRQWQDLQQKQYAQQIRQNKSQLVQQRINNNPLPQQNNQQIQLEQCRDQQNMQLNESQKKGIFTKIKELFTGKQEDFYDQSLVSELNSNIEEKIVAKQKIEELILPITSQPSLFKNQTNSDCIKYNYMQQQQLQTLYESKRNLLPIRILISLFLISIIVLNLIQWQTNQLIYTFSSLLFILFCVFYRHIQSKQSAQKYHIDAFLNNSLLIKNMYNPNELLIQLKSINKNIIIFEQQKNRELFIYDRNKLFSAVYTIKIINQSSIEIQIFTRNYEFIDSIIDNFTINYSQKKGIWSETQKLQSNQDTFHEVLKQKRKQYLLKYQQYKENQKDPFSQGTYVFFQVIINNWEICYEFFALIFLLLSTRDQIQNDFNWLDISHWFLIVNYGITFLKLTYYCEQYFLNLRQDLRNMQNQINREHQRYFQKETCHITLTPQEMSTYEKINDFEVWFVCCCLLTSIVFRNYYKILSVILLPSLKSSFRKRYDQLKKILITVPSILILSVVGIFSGIFFGILYIIWFLLVQLSNLSKFLLRGCKPKRQQVSNQNKSSILKFIEVKNIENYQEQECCICLEGYASANEMVFRCKNKHCYHKNCIIKWITSGNFSATRKCPICRVELLN